MSIGRTDLPLSGRGLGDPEVTSDLGDRRLALAGDRDHITTELRWERFGMTDILPAKKASSQVRSQPNRGQSRGWEAAWAATAPAPRSREGTVAEAAASRPRRETS